MKIQKETLRKKANGAWEVCRQIFLVGTLGSLFVFAPLHTQSDLSPRLVAKSNEVAYTRIGVAAANSAHSGERSAESSRR